MGTLSYIMKTGMQRAISQLHEGLFKLVLSNLQSKILTFKYMHPSLL